MVNMGKGDNNFDTIAAQEGKYHSIHAMNT